MAAPDVRVVLDFLREKGFDRAASALREDVLARAGPPVTGLDSAAYAADGEEEGPPVPPWLPPVRVGVGQRSDDGDVGGRSGSGSSASSSSDAFVSMGSSPSGLTNPYGLWPPYPVESEDSSDRLSQFGTARDYDDPNLFSDMFWEDPYLMKESSGGFTNEDKFVMSIYAEEHLIVPKDLHLAPGTSPKGRVNNFSEIYTCSVSHCDCRDGMKECRGRQSAEQVEVSNPSLLKIPIPMSSYAEIFSRVDESEQSEGMGHAEPHILEKELDMLSSFTFPSCGPLYDLKSRSSSSNAKGSSAINKYDKDFENVSILDLVDNGVSQPNGKDAVEKYGKSDRVSQDHEHAGGKEAYVINNELQLHDSYEDEYEVFNLRIIHRKNRTGFEENKDFPIVLNSIIAGRYYVTEYLGSAAFSKVVQAYDLLTGMDVCLKIIKNDKDFFDQSLDEIKLLKFVNKHDPADEHHILRLYDYFYYQEHLFIVCELLRANLYEFQKFNEDSGGDVYFTLARIQKIARQCLEALEYLHHLEVIHCDLKPENVLIKSYSRCEIKIIDLGSSCFRTDNLCLYVQSRSYRAPEVILGLSYDEKIDIWSLGCILTELFTGDVLFPNDELVLLLARMIGMLGPIDREMLDMGQETHKYFTNDHDLYHRNEETDQVEYIIPERSSLPYHLKGSDTAFVEFLKYMLQINPQRRPTAKQALQHPWLSYLYK